MAKIWDMHPSVRHWPKSAWQNATGGGKSAQGGEREAQGSIDEAGGTLHRVGPPCANGCLSVCDSFGESNKQNYGAQFFTNTTYGYSATKWQDPTPQTPGGDWVSIQRNKNSQNHKGVPSCGHDLTVMSWSNPGCCCCCWWWWFWCCCCCCCCC